VRSVGCQSPSSDENNENDPLSPSASVIGYVTARLDVSAFLCDVGSNVSDTLVADLSEDESDISTTDSSSDDSGLDIRINPGHLRGPFFPRFVNDIAFTFRDMFRSPNRRIMALIWIGYTLSMSMMGSSFLPYMFLYSLLFLIILYAETTQLRDR
jgi:hypothetical protein